jgi:formylglycine-generating enzyme required for sulfatase activity
MPQKLLPQTKALRTLLVLLALVFALPAHAARLALVIGNRDYTVGPLKNPINDAEAMSRTLSGLGFGTTLVKNLKRDDIGQTVEKFVNRIKAGDDVLVFYAGHGLQVKGVNYLPAVDANIRVESDVALNSLNLNQLLDRLDEAKSGVRLLLIDACRDNPYSRSFRSGARGLARVEGAPSGTLMHFATRPGGVAADGTGGNGLYTSELLKHLQIPGLPVESMLKRVAAGVKQASGGDQQPWTEGALDGEFYFAPGSPQQTSNAVQVASIRPEPVQQVAPPAPVQPVQPVSPAAPTLGQVFKDCADCPEMVVISAGSFQMGSNERSAEEPIHSVNIKSFALGKFEVTQGQWKAVMGSNPSKFSNCGDNCPVEQVNWNDVQQYIQKLNQKTGQSYRLPSEAEWEYAARAGSNGQWNSDSDESQTVVRHAWFYYNSASQTHPAGQKLANAFGLHDMRGNVWEWVQDWYHDSYSGAPTDGSAWETGGEQKLRVLRGGAWNGGSAPLLSVFRIGLHPVERSTDLGFRLARTAP